MRIELKACKPKKRKTRPIGHARPALRDLFFKFWDTLHISGMGIAIYFKFGVRIDREAYNPKMQKYVKRVSCRSRDLLFFLDLF